MKPMLIVISLPVLLAACAPSAVSNNPEMMPNPVTMVMTGGGEAPENAQRIATDLRDNMYKTSDSIKKWALTRPEKPSKNPVPASYCYQTLQDVLCYRQPMPGWETRLIGYQGTGVESPLPAMMRPLPVRASNIAMLPANRAVTAKPLIVGAAITPKADEEAKGDEIKAITVDAAHESLPDPALAPQL